MYKANDFQLCMEDYLEPFGGKLDPENRWIRLSALVDWEALETKYRCQFGHNGHLATPFRMAFGGLVVRECLHLTDRETVEAIQENPYMQYFLGKKDFCAAELFSPRSMVRFRTRIPEWQIMETVEQFRLLCGEKAKTSRK